MVSLNSFLLWGVLQGAQPLLLSQKAYGFLKFIPVVGSVAGGATAAVITEGIGFAYLKVLEKCFNDETGEVNLPGEVGMITSLFKENYLNLDTIKQLTQ